MGIELLTEGDPHRGDADENADSDATPAGLAASWVGVMRAYGAFVDTRATDPDLRADAWGDARDIACDGVLVARDWLRWARRRGDDGVVAVALSLRLATQGVFVLTHDAELPNGLFPHEEFLRRFVDVSGALEWLHEYEVEIPGWLLPSPENAA